MQWSEVRRLFPDKFVLQDCIYNFRDGHRRKEMSKIWFTMMLPAVFQRKKELARRRLVEISLFRPEKYDAYYADKPQAGTGIVPKRMRAYIQDLKTYDVRDSLKGIDVPVLVLCGEHDVQCPVENPVKSTRSCPTANW